MWRRALVVQGKSIMVYPYTVCGVAVLTGLALYGAVVSSCQAISADPPCLLHLFFNPGFS